VQAEVQAAVQQRPVDVHCRCGWQVEWCREDVACKYRQRVMVGGTSPEQLRTLKNSTERFLLPQRTEELYSKDPLGGHLQETDNYFTLIDNFKLQLSLLLLNQGKYGVAVWHFFVFIIFFFVT
jgi:hypothetical protein